MLSAKNDEYFKRNVVRKELGEERSFIFLSLNFQDQLSDSAV